MRSDHQSNNKNNPRAARKPEQAMSETYDAVTQFADGWALLYFFLALVAAILFVVRPSLKERYQDAARLTVRDDD
jgi:cbb3-type cytochrome oxidase subunit 3